MDPLLLTIVSIAVGLLVGFIAGTLGVGGGTLLVPAFRLGYGMSALESTATSLFTIIPTSITGAFAHIRQRTCIPSLGLAAGLGGAATSWLGVWLATISPDWATMVAAAIIIAYSAFTMLRKAIKLQRKQQAEGNAAKGQAKQPAEQRTATAVGATPADGASLGPLTARGFVRASGRQVALCVGIGLFAGIASGYVGVGGGFIMVPMMMQLVGMPMRLTSGTSLIAVMILAVPGTIAQALYGNIDWLAGCFVAIGTIPGAIIGSAVMHRIPELALRYLFSAFLFVAAVMLVVNQFHLI